MAYIKTQMIVRPFRIGSDSTLTLKALGGFHLLLADNANLFFHRKCHTAHAQDMKLYGCRA